MTRVLLIVIASASLLACACSSKTNGNAGDPVDSTAEILDSTGEILIVPAEVVDSAEISDILFELPPDPFESWCFGDNVPPQCMCAANEDCLSGFCVFHLGEKVCSDLCVEDCPGYSGCQSAGGVDVQYICKSEFPSLCLPCDHSADCPGPGDRCLVYPFGEGAFCGGVCNEDVECPKGYICAETGTTEGGTVTQCMRGDGICDCTDYAVAEGLGTPCSSTNDFGTCTGWRTCEEPGLSGCNALTPEQEVCDNTADEDCDGVIDDEDICVICSCEGKECGDDGCGESCGACPINHICELEGTCVCVPNCTDKTCGDDGCGDSCGECAPGTKCIFGSCQDGCDNDDGCPDLEECVDGFCQPDMPDSVMLLLPTKVETIPGAETPLLKARVFETDTTEADGQAMGIAAQIGFGDPSYDPATNPQEWAWTDASYSGEDGNGDLYSANLSGNNPALSGYTFRFSLDGVHWIYADSDGSDNGFAPSLAGQWVILAPPQIVSVTPSHGSVLGGTEVTIKGLNFDPALTLTLDGQKITPTSVSETSVVFTSPEHNTGPVPLVLTNPSTLDAGITDAFRYLLSFSPTVDGDLSEWEAKFAVATNTIESNWDSQLNHLETLYAAFDDQYFYLGIAGACESTNYILGYVDIDFGLTTGTADMLELSDNDGDGDLDDALSNVLQIAVDGFGAEIGFGSRGMTSFQQGDDMGNATYVGWREFGLPYDLSWVQGSIICSNSACETAIPLKTIFGGVVPNELAVTAFVLKLTDRYGDAVGISNQTLPEYFNEAAPDEIGVVATMELWL